MGHNVLYTYIASFLAPVGLGGSVSAVLLVFGVVSLASIWITGVLIDRHLRALMIASSALFALAVLALGLLAALPVAVFISAGLWGLAFGGAASLLQTAAADAAGQAADLVQSIMVTGWNIGIAGGGIMGGLLLSGLGAVTGLGNPRAPGGSADNCYHCTAARLPRIRLQPLPALPTRGGPSGLPDGPPSTLLADEPEAYALWKDPRVVPYAVIGALQVRRWQTD